MTPDERETLDARICAGIARYPQGVSFTALASSLGFNDTKGENSFRKVDQRLQALRKRGVIETVKQTWRLAPQPVVVATPATDDDESPAPGI